MKIDHMTSDKTIFAATIADLKNALPPWRGVGKTRDALRKEAIALRDGYVVDHNEKKKAAAEFRANQIENEKHDNVITAAILAAVDGLEKRRGVYAENVKKFQDRVAIDPVDALRWHGMPLLKSAHIIHELDQLIGYLGRKSTYTWNELLQSLSDLRDRYEDDVLSGTDYEAHSTCPMSNLDSQAKFYAKQRMVRVLSGLVKYLPGKNPDEIRSRLDY